MNAKLHAALIERSFAMSASGKDSKYKHYSYIVDGNHVICYGENNMSKTHPISKKFNEKKDFPFIHSELSSIISFPFSPAKLQYYTMYNVRIGKKNNVLLSRPCRGCQKMIMSFGIKKTYYTNELGNFERFVY